MKTYFVYLLLLKNGKIYTGITNNLDRRLQEHFDYVNPNCYTAKYKIEKLIGSIEFSSPTEAIAAEKKIKKWSHAKKLAFINEDWNNLKDLAKRKNTSGKQ